MDIIINPTNKCNFKCDFCAASELCKQTLTSKKTISYLKKLENKYSIGQVIINGGDPLVMSPDYYEDILKYLETLKHPVSLSLTTNLWAFYKDPDKWVNILTNPRVGVITSFQYGTKRKIGNGKVFDEQKFRDVFNLFVDRIGYKPNFIAVIDKSNEFSVLPTVKLAKKLGIRCKINKAIIRGRQKDYYPRYDMFKQYINIIDNGYRDYEMNIELITSYFTGGHTYCDIDRDCYHHLRVINPDGLMYTCSYNAEAGIFKTNLDELDLNKFPITFNTIKMECTSCPNCNLCNSCRIYVQEVLDNNDVENYCKNMKEIIPQLKEKCLK